MKPEAVSVHYNSATTNVADYEPGKRLRIKGIIKEIKRHKDIIRNNESAILVEFVLEVEAPNASYPHQYLIKAFSNTGHDRFNIAGRLGQEFTCYCYLNGRATKNKEGDGTWHNNELSLHSMN